MANIANVMREEITRLSKRASRKELAAVKKASAQQRRHIAALRRELTKLSQQVSAFSRSARAAVVASSDAQQGRRLRFVAKGLRSHRERLGLSAGEFARLIGVSAQTIYNWERGVTRPAGSQLNALAGLRSMGKKDAAARLKEVPAAKPAATPKRAKHAKGSPRRRARKSARSRAA